MDSEPSHPEARPFSSTETLVVRDTRVDGRRPALIIALHGYGMDERQIATLVNIEPAFDHVLVAPRGPIPADGGGYAWVPLVFSGTSPSMSHDDVVRLGASLQEYLAEAVTRHEADPDRVYLVGYSQGGAVVITLALIAPDLGDAFVGIAGVVLPEAIKARDEMALPSPLFIAHGTRDVAVDTRLMRERVQILQGSSSRITYREYPVPHVVSSAQRRDVAAWLEQIDDNRHGD